MDVYSFGLAAVVFPVAVCSVAVVDLFVVSVGVEFVEVDVGGGWGGFDADEGGAGCFGVVGAVFVGDVNSCFAVFGSFFVGGRPVVVACFGILDDGW